MPYIAGTRCSPGKMAIGDEDLRSPEFTESVGEARWKDILPGLCYDADMMIMMMTLHHRKCQTGPGSMQS